MSKKKLIAIASFTAILAFSVIGVASAVAAVTIDTLLAEWLLNGAAIETTLSASTTGTLALIDLKAVLGFEAKVLCTGILDGTIGADGAGEIIEVLTGGGAAIPLTALTGSGLLCSGQSGCTTGTENAELWAVKLPWPTLLELVEELEGGVLIGEPFFAILILKEPGWYVQCPSAIGTQDDTCEAQPQGVAQATNLTGGVSAAFADAITELVQDKLALCSLSKEESAVIEGSTEESSSEGTLQVSSIG